jgi:hypothetical protein
LAEVTFGCCLEQEDVQTPDGEFAPNLVNTVCFLINYQVQLTTFAVNYQGRPFNTGVMENKAMGNMLMYGSMLFVVLALDLVPGLASGLSLVCPPAVLSSPLCVCVCGGGGERERALTWG